MLFKHTTTTAQSTKHGIFKKSFSILALLASPLNQSDKYNGFMNSSKNTEVERLLDQPSEKRSSIHKDIFIKGRQESIEDVISFIVNILVFARFWIKISPSNLGDQPYIIQQISEIADCLSSSKYLSFNEKYKKAHHIWHIH